MTTRSSVEIRQIGDSSEGYKLDGDKPRWDLLPWREVEEVVKVLTAGLEKYPADNWQRVPQARPRYFAAAIRHVYARWGGEKLDPQTGFSHLAHAICCLLFWLWHDKEQTNED